VIRPVLDLRRCHRADAEGDHDVRAPVGGVSEISALARRFNGMAERVRARTGELELLHRTARSANSAKRRLPSDQSHEIRTPMNAVIGISGLLRDTDLDTEQRQFGRILRDSANSLLLLINDILDFSRIEAGRFELEQAPSTSPSVWRRARTGRGRRGGQGPRAALRDRPRVPRRWSRRDQGAAGTA